MKSMKIGILHTLTSHVNLDLTTAHTWASYLRLVFDASFPSVIKVKFIEIFPPVDMAGEMFSMWDWDEEWMIILLLNG